MSIHLIYLTFQESGVLRLKKEGWDSLCVVCKAQKRFCSRLDKQVNYLCACVCVQCRTSSSSSVNRLCLLQIVFNKHSFQIKLAAEPPDGATSCQLKFNWGQCAVSVFVCWIFVCSSPVGLMRQLEHSWVCEVIKVRHTQVEGASSSSVQLDCSLIGKRETQRDRALSEFEEQQEIEKEQEKLKSSLSLVWEPIKSNQRKAKPFLLCLVILQDRIIFSIIIIIIITGSWIQSLSS